MQVSRRLEHLPSTAAKNVFLHPSAEHAVDTDDEGVARFHEIHETGSLSAESGPDTAMAGGFSV